MLQVNLELNLFSPFPAEEDFEPINNLMLTFDASMRNTSVNITILDDQISESKESFEMYLSVANARGREDAIMFLRRSASVIITDDDS